MSNQNSGGIGFVGGLTIVLIAMKLTGYIEISWWWVMSPLLIGLALAIIISLIVIAVMVWSAR